MIEISYFNKESDSLKGQVILKIVLIDLFFKFIINNKKVQLVNTFPNVLIDSSKRETLLSLLKARMKSSLVFKAAMMVFYPIEEQWCSKNADTFYSECPDIIRAIVYFIQTNQQDGLGFPENLARPALTQKCAELRKKIKKISKKKIIKFIQYFVNFKFN